MINFNTDLAIERNDMYRKANRIENTVDGIESDEEVRDENIKITRVRITNSNGEKAINKPIGNYITIDIKNLKIADNENIQKASEIITKELKILINNHIDEKGDIIIVGLGNMYVTPDSLRSKGCKRY